MNLASLRGMLNPGDVLGNYTVVCPLGRGSMGVLYVAEHRLIGRRVALKVIASEIAQHPEALALFFREARAANQIQHPNIIQITDLIEGSADNPAFLVMELLDGYTLREVLEQETRLSPRRAAEIGAAVADAMAAAHRVGVIHRDLKPDNIFMCVGTAELKILDFGIAHLSAESRRESETGLPCGTPLYISPEQAGADGFDERCDIYSLGAILYEAVAGRPVFDYHGVRELLMAHVAETPVPLALGKGPGGALEAVIMACLAKSVEERPLSMEMIAEHLADICRRWNRLETPAPSPVVDEDEFDRRLDELWSTTTDEPETGAIAAGEIIVVEHSQALTLPEPEGVVDDDLTNVLEDLTFESEAGRGHHDTEPGELFVSRARAARGS